MEEKSLNKLYEDFVKRANTHQTHFEDLALLGPDGIAEIDDKIKRFLDTTKGEDVGLNTTTKIDGAPAVICYSKFTGYPDNSICLKSFVANANNVLSSEDDIKAKYGDRPSMVEKLIYCLQLAKLIPTGEAWQGDCLFSTDDKKVENIHGKEYITFQPNKIVYAFSEDNPGYENVKNADFGIAFHTVYKDDGDGGKSQSFRPATDKVEWPSWAYIMSPALSVDKSNFNIEEIEKTKNDFEEQSMELIKDPAYNDLVHNEVFMQYWNTFENANIADKKQVEIDPKTVINDLSEYVAEKQTAEFQKKFGSLKTNKGKMGAIDKWAGAVAELKEIIDYNEETIYKLVKVLNTAARIKMMMWSGFKTANHDYSTFYKSRSKGIIDANMEGVAMSDADGNIVKIVDRTEFSSANRDPDIMAGWEHPGENIKETLDIIFGKKRITESVEADNKSGTAVLAFGRMNPPTIGHLKLVKKMDDIAKSIENGHGYLFLSHSVDKNNEWKNPLPYDKKVKFVKDMLKYNNIHNVDVVESEAKTIIDALHELYTLDYKNVIYVGGEDRIGGEEDMTATIEKYNGYEAKNPKQYYKFDSIEFVSAGHRDDNANDLSEKASASYARQLVKDGDEDTFGKICPFDDTTATLLWDTLEGIRIEEKKYDK